jgi:predicted anti-sigma-YlaC factor YlaD
MLQPVVCERVRSSISLEIDGELSELERRMVSAHLARCADCQEFKADVLGFTFELRNAPLEHLDHPISVHQPRRVSFPRMQVGIAAAVAVVAVGLVAQIAGSKPEQSSLLSKPVQFGTSSQLTREVQRIVADGRAFGREQGTKLPI